MDIKPLLVAPFDAELFGHWWFEGPSFLAELFQQSNKERIVFTRLKDVLVKTPNLQLCDPCPSSWGQGGYHNYWLNEKNAWIVPEITKAGSFFIELCSKTQKNETSLRFVRQAAR